MLELAKIPKLTVEPVPVFLPNEMRMQLLDGVLSAEIAVVGEPHLAHATFSELLQEGEFVPHFSVLLGA
jgi:hypothetical protein